MFRYFGMYARKERRQELITIIHTEKIEKRKLVLRFFFLWQRVGCMPGWLEQTSGNEPDK